MVTYNDYYHSKRIIMEPSKGDIHLQDLYVNLDETEDVNDQDYQNPCKVGSFSLEEDFKKTTKAVIK